MIKLTCKLSKKIKSNLNVYLKSFKESCYNLFLICVDLVLIFCSYAHFKIEQAKQHRNNNMDQQAPPNQAAGGENNEDELELLAAEIMEVDDMLLEDFFENYSSSDSEDTDEELDSDEMDMPDSTDDSEHSDIEEDHNMNVDNNKIPELVTSSISDFYDLNNKTGAPATTTTEDNFIIKKPTYVFKPLDLVRDKFLNKNLTNGIPTARSGHRIIANDANLYSLGGYNPRSALEAARHNRCMLFQELWRYNFATKRWKLIMNVETMPEMPRELASNALVMYKNVLISHGGTGYPFGESCSNDCYAFSTHDKPWLQQLNVTGELPTPLYGPAMVIHDDYLYTIGGTTGFDYACDVFRLNLKTRIWENLYNSRPEMRDDPEGRYRHEIVYDGKYIYVLGGGTSLNVFDLQRIPAFNLITNRWEFFDTLPDRTVANEISADAMMVPQIENAGFPKPRKCFTCVQHKMDNGDIEAFITGGLQGDFSTYFADVWKLNIRTLQWTLIRTATLPKALYFHSAADTGHGQMYIFGGIEYNEKEMRRRNRVYKMWMTIPKLSEICWDAITYYNDNLGTCDPQKLLSYGIPKRFVERIEFLPKPRRFAPSAAANAGDSEQAQQNQTSFACTTL